MPKSPQIDLLRQNSMAVLVYKEWQEWQARLKKMLEEIEKVLAQQCR